MERSAIVPHISWRGPQPERETEAYLLAMLLRIHASGLDEDDGLEHDALMQPSILTVKNMGLIAVMYAYYKQKMDDLHIVNVEAMLKLIKESDEDCVDKWEAGNTALIRKAEAELLEYVETKETRGFSAFG